MLRTLATLSVVLLGVSGPVLAQAPPDEKAIKKDIIRTDLFIGITRHDAAMVNDALAHGADIESHNLIDVTPIQWAGFMGDRKIVDILLAHKAKLDAQSIYGSAFSMAVNARHPELAAYFLDKGANPNSGRIDSITPLMLASMNGYTPLVKRLLNLKCDPNKIDADGAAALTYAARGGYVETAKTLLGAGAKVDLTDSHGRTPLMYAALNGHAGMVDYLISKGAAVNAKDKAGSTALLLAARYNGEPAVIASLIKNKANASVRDAHGKTPYSLCQTRGFADGAAALGKAGAQANVRTVAMEAVPAPKAAVEKSIGAIQNGMRAFYDHAKCSSCHHQGVGLMALGAAAKNGYKVDGKLIGDYMARLQAEGKEGAQMMHAAAHDKNLAKLAPGVDLGDGSIGIAYIFGGMRAVGVPPNPGFVDVALILAGQQEADGHWGYGIDRVPMQGSYFTTTALSLQILRSYAPREEAANMEAVYAKAKSWLLTTPAPNAEDKASKLLGLKLAGASDAEIEAAAKAVQAAQRPDGGWAQLPNLRSDAYATSLAIYSLRVAGGVPAADANLQKGVQFLLRTQDEDGSWYVNKRALPANTYFDSGFPHGESQFISFGATCWAAMALMETMPAGQSASR